MDKAEEFLTNKGVLNVEWDTDECGKFTLTELLDEYANEVSREILTILKGAKQEYNGGHHKEETNAAFKGGIQTAIHCVEAYLNNGLNDFQNRANYNSGLKEQEEQK